MCTYRTPAIKVTKKETSAIVRMFALYWGHPITLYSVCLVHRGGGGGRGGEGVQYIGDTPNVLMISLRCTQDIRPHKSRYSSEALNILRCTQDIPHINHDIPPKHWTSPVVLMISPTWIMISSNVLKTPPRCTHDIPLHESWFSPMYWTSPDVFKISPDVFKISPDVLMVYSPDVLNTHYTECQYLAKNRNLDVRKPLSVSITCFWLLSSKNFRKRKFFRKSKERFEVLWRNILIS